MFRNVGEKCFKLRCVLCALQLTNLIIFRYDNILVNMAVK